MDKSFNYSKGALIWVSHPSEIWQPATVSEVLPNNKLKIFFSDADNKIIDIKKGYPVLRSMSCEGDLGCNKDEMVDDLTTMRQLTTPDVLYFLRKNYFDDKFYVKLGSGTILALNPFKEVPKMFSEKTIQKYNTLSQTTLQQLPPHIYACSQSALIKLRLSLGQVNQSIIVSGESGAGKTWTVRCLMRYLAEIGIEHRRRLSSTCSQEYEPIAPINLSLNEPFEENVNYNNNIPVQLNKNPSLYGNSLVDLDKSIEIVDRIEHRILYSNPILEAFGNARTLRNQNSSRFGKYIQLQYDRTGSIIGASLKTYLLEKTRAVHHDIGERSYHIFYQIIHGATNEEKQKWKFPENPFPEEDDDLLEISKRINDKVGVMENDKHAVDLDESDILLGEEEVQFDVNEFNDTRSSMLKIGISLSIQENIFTLLAAVLHLKMLTFIGDDDLSNTCELDPYNSANEESLKIAANILGETSEDLLSAIRLRKITTRSGSNKRKSVFHRPCTVEECYTRKGCLAKFIYESLFYWIVGRIGEIISAPDSTWCSFIGLLDVYGFESFKNNSLEQLCINYANEKLQQHFVKNFLREQQEEYASEGVEWTHCDLTDNVECLLSLEAPRSSIFALLNEECRLNRPSDHKQLMDRISVMFEKNKYISLPRIASKDPSFIVTHYAGKVAYKTELLVVKNKDELPLEILVMLRKSSNTFLCDILNSNFEDIDTKETSKNVLKGKSSLTVITKFKNSLDDLLETLESTDCHYIRCIKPNLHSVPNKFNSSFVMDQLEASGVVETVRVCAPAFPNKMSYCEFLNRYCFLNKQLKHAKVVEIGQGDGDYTNGEESLSREERCLKMLSVVNKTSENATGIDDVKQSIQFGKTKIFLSSEMFEKLESARTGEMVACAIMIQAHWQRYYHRKKCRERIKLLVQERHNAAKVLQKRWIHILLKRKCRKQRALEIATRDGAAKTLQRFWLAYRSRRNERHQRQMTKLLRYKACLKIQSVQGLRPFIKCKVRSTIRGSQKEEKGFRGWRVRWKYKDLLDAWRQLKLVDNEATKENAKEQLKGLVEITDKSTKESSNYFQKLQNVSMLIASNSHSVLTNINSIQDKISDDSDVEKRLHSSGGIRYAKIVKRKTQSERIKNQDFDNLFLTRQRNYTWHTRPSVLVMTNKGAGRHGLGPMDLLKLSFKNKKNSKPLLYDLFHETQRVNLPPTKTNHIKNHRHAMHSSFNLTSTKTRNTSHESIYPKYYNNCILKHADVKPF